MILFLLFLINLFLVFYQDFRDRKVHVFLFLSAILIGAILFLQTTSFELFLSAISINLTINLFIFITLFFYAKFKLNKKLLETIGIGDFLFFILFAVSFPTISFVVLFSISLIFSLFFFVLLKSKLKQKTVPLAGLQSLFLGMVLIVNKLFSMVDLYVF